MKKKFNLWRLLYLLPIMVVYLLVYSFISSYTHPPASSDNPFDLFAKPKPKEPIKIKIPTERTKEAISAKISGERLYITFDYGDEWKEVPVEFSELTAGEYIPSNENGLMAGSYYLSKDHCSFILFTSGYVGDLKLVQSDNKGDSWEEYDFGEFSNSIHYRKIEYLNNEFGYLVTSGGRIVGQEGAAVYLTNDGGRSWKEASKLEIGTLVTDSSFTDMETGFVTFKSSIEAPLKLLTTQNAGKSWEVAVVNLPSEYEKIFIDAESPYNSEGALELLANQGEEGDYQGGLVKGKFISQDNGVTWDFVSEIFGNNKNK